MSKTKKESPSLSLIETDGFPIDFLSELAQKESWRKEIYRPVYHVHKWWAKRLGSVFRGMILGCLLRDGQPIKDWYYSDSRFDGVKIFDPFMGSGTTVGEASKLGCHVYGRDINPVACEAVRVALGNLNRQAILTAFNEVEKKVSKRILSFYETSLDDGSTIPVLYYFWVKWLPCPECQGQVDLFSSYIFSRNALSDKRPEVQILCPSCNRIIQGLTTDHSITCSSCKTTFDPHKGNTNGTTAVCNKCSHTFKIAKTVSAGSKPPEHRIYAKMALYPSGRKVYLPATKWDLALFEKCQGLLKKAEKGGSIKLPSLALSDGYNTNQAINYNYTEWRQFFNDRQLLALGILQDAISQVEDPTSRDILFCVFSGLLEFNNMFASFKGEGTGAVRHMFAHHILKPERTPIEANIWGTSKSSGSFLTLFKSRVMRAIEYREAPFEVGSGAEGKRFLPGSKMTAPVFTDWPGTLEKTPSIHLSCGDSGNTGLPDQSIDFVVTDPPFFDNVHYSELADFFQAWQSLYPHGFIEKSVSTRNPPAEVQDGDADRFSSKLAKVFRECHRVLKQDGLLVFSYHHSRPEGWSSLIQGIWDAGFSVVNSHPIKAEMSVAAPKAQAKDPIQLDTILVCCKREMDGRKTPAFDDAIEAAVARSSQKLASLVDIGLKLSSNDCFVATIAQYLSIIGPIRSWEKAVETFELAKAKLTSAALEITEVLKTRKPAMKQQVAKQMTFASLDS